MMRTSTTHPNPKVAAAQQRILDADDQIRAILQKRLEVLADEEAAAKKAKKKAEQEALREAALEILLSIKFDMSTGKTVTGTVGQTQFIDLSASMELRTRPAVDFTVTNVHLGRKHLGVHVRYEQGNNERTGPGTRGWRQQHWVRASSLTEHGHALHNGRQYRHPETKPRLLRETDGC